MIWLWIYLGGMAAAIVAVSAASARVGGLVTFDEALGAVIIVVLWPGSALVTLGMFLGHISRPK
jgi:hypothetical protein